MLFVPEGEHSELEAGKMFHHFLVQILQFDI